MFSEPFSSIGDETVLDEVKFAGLIINKLHFVFSFLLDTFYVNILGPPLSLRVRGHVASISRSKHGGRGEEERRGKGKEV
jgi:hypothetical protein